ncbi:hypothetical protein KKB06_01500, partial [Patescibacteria group bacterium]|nr:hypothetical protein [Patescibacteria group bacterium]
MKKILRFICNKIGLNRLVKYDMSTRKIRNSWWIDFRFNRERHRKKSPDNSRAGAEAYEAVMRQKLAIGESLVNPDKKKKEQKQQFKEFAWEWFKTYVK